MRQQQSFSKEHEVLSQVARLSQMAVCRSEVRSRTDEFWLGLQLLWGLGRASLVHLSSSQKDRWLGYLSFVPPGEDDAYPNVSQSANRHVVTFPFPPFAVIVVSGPSLLAVCSARQTDAGRRAWA